MNRIAALLLAAISIAPITALAQTSIAPPTSGLLIGYTYWPTQYVQWIGTELPYSMVELDVDSSAKQPLLYVTLIERGSGKRVHYTNSDALLATAKAQGEEIHKTEIAFDGSDTLNNGSVSNLRFSMADGKPFQWRFVQGSDVSEQGSGLTALPDAKIPIFAYREEGAVAGEGTALQIGDITSTAEVWKEISHPPYFVGYRGALTQSAHTIVFTAGEESWTVVSSPSALAAGATWELDGATGNHRTLRVDKVDGAHITVSGTDRFTPSVRFVLNTTRSGDDWTVESARFSPLHDGDKHFITLQLAPGTSPDQGQTVSLSVGKKKAIASAKLTTTGSASDRSLALEFTTPAWAHDKKLTEETKVAASSLSTVSYPQ